jgi:starch phosphorylase
MEEVGEDNIFIFGLRAQDIQEMRTQGSYQPREYCARYPALMRVMDALYADLFCRGEPDLFRWIYHALVDHGDEYFHLADLPSYLDVQEQAGREFRNEAGWA